jgi:hypothetical protein
MKKLIIRDEANIYERINKSQAKKLLASGKCVAIVPHKIRPGFPFAMHSTLYPEKIDSFEETIRYYKYMNCNSTEVGLYPSFYRVSERR